MTDNLVIAMFTPGGVTIHKTRDCLGPAKDSPYVQEIPMPPAGELVYDLPSTCCYCGKPLASLRTKYCPVAREWGIGAREPHALPDVHEGYYVHDCLRAQGDPQ